MNSDTLTHLLEKLIRIFPMPEKLRTFCLKSIQLILYLIVGVITTLLNGLLYWISAKIWNGFDCCIMFGSHPFYLTANLIATAIAWFVAVIFAFFANKLLVFSSKNMSARTVLWEMFQFIGCRFGSGIIDQTIMWVSVDIYGWNGLLMKLISDFIVTILNFFASKFLIFRKKK